MKINTDGIEIARTAALLRIHTVGRNIQQKIIDLFRTFEIPTFQCVQCKRETEHKFNLAFLQYNQNQRTCDDCMKKSSKANEDQKLLEKTNAYNVFKERHDVSLDYLVKKSNVPFIFTNAKESDMEAVQIDTLKAHQSYFITGDVGVGKTHLAVALLRKYLTTIRPYYDERQKEYLYDVKEMKLPIFVEVPELLLKIRDTYNNESKKTEKDIIDYYTKTPLLILDDLGVEKASDFSLLTLYLIINRRCSNDMTTIITSNLSIEEISDRLSGRISSRIKGMCKIISMSGCDRRLEGD